MHGFSGVKSGSVTVLILLFIRTLTARRNNRGSIRRVFRQLPILVTLCGAWR